MTDARFGTPRERPVRRGGISRRDMLRTALCLASAGAAGLALAQEGMRRREIPASGDTLPVIGLGTYDVFDVRGTDEEIALRGEIVDALIAAGGSVIDTSPMYNRSEAVIGRVLAGSERRSDVFIATKVWTDGREAGLQQMRRSAERMGVARIDLMQVHNRRDLDTHWPTIRGLKEEGFLRYDGITDYRERAHGAMMDLMRSHRPDFVQINYSLGERGAEQALLPLAQELGIAVLVNRPFMAGRLFRAAGDRPLPDWAGEFADSWGQFFLKYIISHPAVTCAIPATSRLRHMIDNAGAGSGPLPDEPTRRRMVSYFQGL